MQCGFFVDTAAGEAVVVVSRGAQERGGTATPACNGSAWYNVNAAENSWEPSKPSRLQPGAMQRLGKTNSVHGVVVVGGEMSAGATLASALGISIQTVLGTGPAIKPPVSRGVCGCGCMHEART